ncbi:MAG: phage tail protein I [Leptolyngbyaceae cyanobacterium RU_5_1]|nr:phage tail protein I [Leptolyngbyaceae cyanobacterium RU_5_1]
MTIDTRPNQTSSLLNDLPAIFQEGSAPGEANFLGRFLLAFERILLGLEEISAEIPQPGLEEIVGGGRILDARQATTSQEKLSLAGIQRYFEPGEKLPATQRSPSEFLPWLASWVALTLREDWGEAEQRRFIGQIVPLYQKRGTKSGIMEMLKAYTGMGVGAEGAVELFEFTQPLTVGDRNSAIVGVNTLVGGAPPHYFLVKMFLNTFEPTIRERQEQIARAIIDQEKPAHTYYDLQIEVPTMQIGTHSTVGVDTLLGTPGTPNPTP